MKRAYNHLAHSCLQRLMEELVRFVGIFEDNFLRWKIMILGCLEPMKVVGAPGGEGAIELIDGLI